MPVQRPRRTLVPMNMSTMIDKRSMAQASIVVWRVAQELEEGRRDVPEQRLDRAGSGDGSRDRVEASPRRDSPRRIHFLREWGRE